MKPTLAHGDSAVFVHVLVVVVFIKFSVVQGYERGSAARVALMFFCHHHKPVAIIFIAVRRIVTSMTHY